MNWLKTEIHGKKIVLYVIALVAIDIIYNLGILSAIQYLHVDLHLSGSSFIREKPQITTWLVLIIFTGAFVEECVFRFPLHVQAQKGWSMQKLLIMAVVSSILFGYMHGGIGHILTQGVGGFAYCILFIKCGGLSSKPGKALIATTSTHILFNMTIITLIAVHNRFST